MVQLCNYRPPRVTVLVGVILVLAELSGSVSVNVSAALPELHVSKNGRHLELQDGTPFFYLADTAWELLHRLDREEANRYLRYRAGQGFNVIQAVALAELNGLHDPNAYGHTPLIDDDPTRPNIHPGVNDDYWDHVDWITDRAADLGIYTALLPTWGSHWDRSWSTTGPLEGIFTPDSAQEYGEWIGERYHDRPIIWVLGGDRPIPTDHHMATIEAMARGIRRAVGRSQLITYHPCGGKNSSTWLHNKVWLDFNMFQSGHSDRPSLNYRYNETNYALNPPKPSVDGEPCYEDIGKGLRDHEDRFDDVDVRQSAYWSILSGACGHTYGHNSVWQMWAPGRTPMFAADVSWHEALHHAGASQMRILRQFFQQAEYWNFVPDQSLIGGNNPAGRGHIRAARTRDASRAVFYTHLGRAIEIASDSPLSGSFCYRWFNPRTGNYSAQGNSPNVQGSLFAPATQGRGADWVLILDRRNR